MKKIVIEITEDDYNSINLFPDRKTLYPITERLFKAVNNGTPLEEHCDSCVFYHEESEE